MFQFIGYNFYSDGDALTVAPSSVPNITTTTISNAIFDHLNLTRNTSTPVSTTIPVDWDYDTIVNANFEGDLNGGNIDFLISQISSIKIKRRVKGTFDWLTLAEVPINTVADLTFVFNDRLNAYGVEYDYAFVPVLNDIEGEYIINTILSKFEGVFIGDANSAYKLMYDVNYGTNSRNQQIGTFEPLGRQFPVFVANGLLSYESGTVIATVMNDEYEDTGKIDRKAIVDKKDILKDYLTNRKAKILKDWNGNIWLCIIVNSPQVSYRSGSGMGIPQVSFDWVEIGQADSQQDLYANGILDILE